MKNAFKLGFLALALSLTVVACNSEKTAEATDSTAIDSTSLVADSTVADSTAVVADSTATTVATDSVATK